MDSADITLSISHIVAFQYLPLLRLQRGHGTVMRSDLRKSYSLKFF